MASKAYGKDIRDFYDNHFPDGYYHEDSEIPFYDEETGKQWLLQDDRQYDLSTLGWLDGKPPIISFEDAFSAWFDNLGVETLVVRVPAGRKDEVVKALAALGIEIA